MISAAEMGLEKRRDRLCGLSGSAGAAGRRGAPAYDVEVVLLHDRQEEPACLVAAAERLAAEGSVLVAKEIPPQVKWRRLMRLREGRLEAVE